MGHTKTSMGLIDDSLSSVAPDVKTPDIQAAYADIEKKRKALQIASDLLVLGQKQLRERQAEFDHAIQRHSSISGLLHSG